MSKQGVLVFFPQKFVCLYSVKHLRNGAVISCGFDRVASFYDSYIDLGKKLKSVYTSYNSGITKLKPEGPSITTSAKQVMELGIKRSKGKEFTVPEEMLEIGNADE